MKKWVALLLVLCACISLCACGGGASKETVLDSYSSSLAKEDVVKQFGDKYEEMENDSVRFEGVSCFGKEGVLRSYWLADFCAWTWSYEKKSETEEEFEKLTSSIIKQLEKKYGTAEKSSDVYTWNHDETEIELTVGKKDIYLRQRSNDPYFKGLWAISNGKYKNGSTMLEEIGRFDVNSEEVKEAMYDYVVRNMKTPYQDTFYEYIYKLNKDGYKDAADRYTELYSWKMTVTGITTKKESMIIEDSLNINDTVYFSIDLTGGIPDGKTKITWKTTYPNGKTYTNEMKDEWDKGWSGWVSAGPCKSEGTLKVDFYDGDGNHIGSGSVRIVK